MGAAQRMLARFVWAAVAAAIACGPTDIANTQFAGRGVPLQEYPFTIVLSGATFGRELTASQEASNIPALMPAVPAGNGGGWYYRYTPVQPNDNLVGSGYDFIPEFFQASDVTSPNLTAVTTGSNKWILGFNEPDGSSNSMSVVSALTLWPQLEATGKKLVSPSCTCDQSSGTAGNWFHDFVNGVGGGGYIPHFDAISVHHYTANFGDATGGDLFTYLTNVHNKYPDKELWLTEFGMIAFGGGGYAGETFPTSVQAQAYMATVIPKLRNLPYVTRFSWYPDSATTSAVSVNPGIANVTLANPDGTLTTLGTLYSGLDQAPANDVPSTAFAQVFVLPPSEERKRRVRRPHTRMRRAA